MQVCNALLQTIANNSTSHMHSLSPTAETMTNEADPNFIGYVKHLTSQLLMDNDMLQLPYPEFKKEKLKTIVDDSVDFLMRETDRITDQIISNLHMELDPSDLSQLIRQPHKTDKHINDRNRKRKVSSKLGANIPNKNFVGKVHNNTKALREKGEIGLKDLHDYSAVLQAELDKMEQNLEDFLNIIFSKCRPMTKAEKEQLGRLIKKLPEKALDHVVQIIQDGKLSKGEPSEVFVDLEKQDDITLWRLQYYVYSVSKVNKLSNCNPIPLPLI